MKLVRYKKSATSIMGVLKDDKGGTYYTLENAEKAIPAGDYIVDVTYSPKFLKDLPLVVSNDKGVTAARGIRIHQGNTAKDSNGCILLGNTANLETLRIGNSKKAMEQFMRNVTHDLKIEGIV